MSDHKHKWKAVMHLDGCHHYTNTYACACGAMVSISGERQFLERGKFTPSVMMASEGDCERCPELIRGARRKPTQIHAVLTRGASWTRISRAKLRELSA